MPATRLNPHAQALLNDLANDTREAWYNGVAWIAGNRRGVQNATRVGREMATLIRHGMVEGRNRVLLTPAGIQAADTTPERKAELTEAYRVRHLPLEVYRPEGVCYPEKMIVQGEPERTAPRSGARTFDVSDTLTPSRKQEGHDYDVWDVDVVLKVGRNRHEIGFCGPDSATRRVDQGPLVQGVYAYVFALPVCIPAHGNGSGAVRVANLLAGREFDAQYGDVVEIRGFLFVIVKANNDNIRLVRAEI